MNNSNIVANTWQEDAYNFKIIDSFNNYKKILKKDWLEFSGENWDWYEGRVIRGIGIWVKMKDWEKPEYWPVDVGDINERERYLKFGKGRNATTSIKRVTFWVERAYEKVFEKIFQTYPELKKSKCFFVRDGHIWNKVAATILIYEE